MFWARVCLTCWKNSKELMRPKRDGIIRIGEQAGSEGEQRRTL
jgi:hypothetical protein